MCLANKPVEFKTKLIHDNKIYLKLSDVAKALGYKQQDFINKHPSILEKISGVQCILETDYNKLLSDNESALSLQGQIEVTKVESLRAKVDSVMSFQPLKMLFARDYLQMVTTRNGCGSIEEYIVTHELPKEKQKALQELIQDKESNSHYQKMIDYLHDKEQFDIDIRSCGLDVQFLTSIKSDGRINLDVYVVGRAVFRSITDFGDYALWNDMYIDDGGDVILPWCNYDSNNPEERLINISVMELDRDFKKYNAIENMLWCIENLKVDALEDYEYEIFGFHGDTIDFSMGIELLAKVITPNAIDTIYTDRVIDEETGLYLTEFDKENVFEEDFRKK